MKSAVVLLLLSAMIGYAQTFQTPEKEFTVSLSDENVTLARGEQKTVDVKILKSKAYQKGKIKMGISSALPQGLTLSFDPETGNADLSKATITVLADATPGSYNVIVNATVNYKTKGSILKITVK
jgi:uncharacterized membrane protein